MVRATLNWQDTLTTSSEALMKMTWVMRCCWSPAGQLTCVLLCLTATALTQRSFPCCLRPSRVLLTGLWHSNTVCRWDFWSNRCLSTRGEYCQPEAHSTKHHLITHAGTVAVLFSSFAAVQSRSSQLLSKFTLHELNKWLTDRKWIYKYWDKQLIIAVISCKL